MASRLAEGVAPAGSEATGPGLSPSSIPFTDGMDDHPWNDCSGDSDDNPDYRLHAGIITRVNWLHANPPEQLSPASFV
jgi:hypothetical protein